MAVWILWGLLATVVAFAAYVRLAPSDPAVWHVAPNLYGWDHDGPWDVVVPMEGAASSAVAVRPVPMAQIGS